MIWNLERDWLLREKLKRMECWEVNLLHAMPVLHFTFYLNLLVFDESGNFLIYATLLGIKVVNMQTNKVSILVGGQENLRFMNIALYQGAPKKKSLVTVDMAASENTVIKESEQTDPTLFCTAFKKSRFYCFSRREPDSSSGTSGGRDIFNEKPTKDEQSLAAANYSTLDVSTAIIHTEYGDIYIKLFPEKAPKAVKNFIEHGKSGTSNLYSLITFRVL